MKRILLAIALWSIGCWCSSQAQTPIEWLERMERAERTIALDGVRVTQFFLPVPLPPVHERVQRAGVRYRVEYLQPPPRRGEVLIDDGIRRFHYIPSLKQVRVLRSDQPQMLRRRQDLLQRLRRREMLLTVRGIESVAGREAVLLETRTPQGNLIRRWWIDREYGVILRMEELTPRGEVRLRSEYVRLTLPASISPQRFVPHFPAQVKKQDMLPPSQVFASVQEAQLLVPFAIRQPQELPKGFRLVEVRVRMVGMRPLVSLHYTDDSSSLVLFQTRLPLRANGPFLKSLAPLAARVEAWRNGDVNMVLVGDAPTEVFEQMRKELR
ncbi:MAG: sigma-E factor regulatory protein RseB domain-containing protein [Armatimonadota bacterium]